MTDQLPVLADRAHALSLDTVSSLRTFRLSAESRLVIAALGVVYGDIGTSPLYAAPRRRHLQLFSARGG